MIDLIAGSLRPGGTRNLVYLESKYDEAARQGVYILLGDFQSPLDVFSVAAESGTTINDIAFHNVIRSTKNGGIEQYNLIMASAAIALRSYVVGIDYGRKDGAAVRAYSTALSYFNTGTDPLIVTITLYGMDGARVSSAAIPTRASLRAGEQRDFIINDMNGFEKDRYGIVKVEFSNQHYNGRVAYYKPAEGEQISWTESDGEQFDYVFVNPFVNPVKGTSYVSYNTYQPRKDPSESNHLIPNWLTIINAHSTDTKYFKVRKYDEQGSWLEVTETVGTVRQSSSILEGP